MPGEKDGIPEMDLDQAMKDGMEKFDGELQEAAAKGVSNPADKADETAPPVNADEEKKDTPPASEKKEGETQPKAEASGAETPEKKEGAAAPEKRRLFKDQDEAEENYKNLQRSMSRAGEKNQELVSKLREKEESDAMNEKIVTADKDYRVFLKKRMKETTGNIDKLDPDAEDYDEKIADLRAEEQADIRAYERQHPEVFGEAVMRTSPRPSAPAASPVTDKRSELENRIKEILVESKTEWDAQDPVFMFYARQAEKADAQGNPIPFDNQVQTAIERTNAHYGKIVDKRTGERQKNAEEEALKAQETDLPLGRGATGGKGGPAGTTEQPVVISIDAALENLNRERTL